MRALRHAWWHALASIVMLAALELNLWLLAAPAALPTLTWLPGLLAVGLPLAVLQALLLMTLQLLTLLPGLVLIHITRSQQAAGSGDGQSGQRATSGACCLRGAALAGAEGETGKGPRLHIRGLSSVLRLLLPLRQHMPFHGIPAAAGALCGACDGHCMGSHAGDTCAGLGSCISNRCTDLFL